MLSPYQGTRRGWKAPEGNQANTATLLPEKVPRPTKWQVTFRLVRFEGKGSSVLHVIQAGWLATALLFISEAKDKWSRNVSLNHKIFRQRHGKFLREARGVQHIPAVEECLLEEEMTARGG